MKLTTRFRYGTRALLDLAVHSGSKPVSLKEIAERQGISHKYLESLFSTLQASGIVNSVRGPRGGYKLARKPHQVTLRILYDILEGTGPLSDCTADPESCERHEGCVTREVWAQMYDQCMAYLDSVTLETLIDRTEEVRFSSASYCI
jgi:Rrf2 family transcriptional regulator, cysteine metabolism repressor